MPRARNGRSTARVPKATSDRRCHKPMISTRLLLVYLGIASFAPVVLGLRPGRWVPYYYGALLIWWGLVSVASVRRIRLRDQTLESQLSRAIRQRQDIKGANAQPQPGAARDVPSLIVVARDDVDLYDRLRNDQMGDEAVRVITDRRSADRRRQLELYIPDRRRGERRSHDIAPLLLAQGWAQVTRPKG
jgi:hypothetical protein